MTSTTERTATLAAGQLVRYAGSAAARHGLYRVQFASVTGGKVRYDLTYPQYGVYSGADAIALYGVRPESVTPAREKVAR